MAADDDSPLERSTAAFGLSESASQKYAKALERALQDITPVSYACTTGFSCPAVLVDEQSRSYVIVGKKFDPERLRQIGKGVGDDEWAIEISMDLVDAALKNSKT